MILMIDYSAQYPKELASYCVTLQHTIAVQCHRSEPMQEYVSPLCSKAESQAVRVGVMERSPYFNRTLLVICRYCGNEQLSWKQCCTARYGFWPYHAAFVSRCGLFGCHGNVDVQTFHHSEHHFSSMSAQRLRLTVYSWPSTADKSNNKIYGCSLHSRVTPRIVFCSDIHISKTTSFVCAVLWCNVKV